MKICFCSIARTWQCGLLACASVGLVFAVGGPRADAQDRIDAITDSAAEIQQSESYGQPNERTGADQQTRGQDSYYEEGYRGGEFERSFDQQARRQESPYRGDQQAQRDRRDEAPGGLGVVLRETGDQGVQVRDVHRGSPADEAGLQPGDSIVAIDGRSVRSVRELQSRVMQRDPGERIEVVVVRNGRERVLDARLESRREALARGRQQAPFRDEQFTQRRQTRQTRFQDEAWQGQDRQVQARLAAVERQLQQLLREVRTLRSEVQGSSPPQAPRQAQRQDDWFDGGQQFRQQQRDRQQDRQQDQRQQSRQGRMDEQQQFEQRSPYGGTGPGSPGDYDF